MSVEVEIGVGRGPREAQKFARMLTSAMCRHLRQHSVRVTEVRAPRQTTGTFRGVLRLAHENDQEVLRPWIGTHLLVATLRGSGQRRRWFAVVSLRNRSSARSVDPKDIEVRFVRSRGPGGQNVNKRDSAVMLIHRPSGIRVYKDEHRTQARNRASAHMQLEEALKDEGLRRQRDAENGRWKALKEYREVAPVMRWSLDPANPNRIVQNI